ncbi:MAG: MarR family transcriptional regulator [Oligoflexia bacterium]|nr:MarR family transcriptional regulator [Oligoflexia bacterium]
MKAGRTNKRAGKKGITSEKAYEFGFRVSLVARHWRQLNDQVIRPLNLTDAVWRPLLHVARLGKQVNQKQLAQSLGIEGSSLARLIDQLEEQGLIRRIEAPQDRRAKLISLTDRGNAVVTAVQTRIGESHSELLSEITEQDLENCMQILDRIEAKLLERL